MKRNAVLMGLTVLLALGVPARASYWVNYDASQGLFPEQVGWERYVSQDYGGALRYFENGALLMDSRANPGIYDAAYLSRPIDPASGETFVAEWRILIEANLQNYDQSIGFARDQLGTLEFDYSLDVMRSLREGWSIPIVPGVFHDYRVESTDMVHYRLWLDENMVHDGLWDLNSLNRSFVTWGDEWQFGGSGSLARWEYMRFGAVPEPGSASLMLLTIVCHVGRRVRFR